MNNTRWRLIGAGLALLLVTLALPLIGSSAPALASINAGLDGPGPIIPVQPPKKPDNGVPFLNGDVFAGVGAGLINHHLPTGTLVDTLNTTSGSLEQTGMCFDVAGNLYATDFNAHVMTKFNNLGELVAHPYAGPFGNHPESCVYDAAGNMYTGEVDNPFPQPKRLRKFTADGSPITTWTPAVEIRGIDWIDLAADQCTMFYTSEGNNVKRFDVCTGQQLPDFNTQFLTGEHCYALRIRDNGEVLVTCAQYVYRLRPDGSIMQTYTPPEPPSSFVFAMNLDPDGHTFWTGGYFTGNIY